MTGRQLGRRRGGDWNGEDPDHRENGEEKRLQRMGRGLEGLKMNEKSEVHV